MARKRKLQTGSDAGAASGDEGYAEGYASPPPESNVYTVVVASHTHAGVPYKSGDSIVIDFQPTVDKLKAKGIIS